MKRTLILLALVAIIVVPASAAVWNISGTSADHWTVTSSPAAAGNMGDGDIGTSWYNGGFGTYTEATWNPVDVYYSNVRFRHYGVNNEYWSANGVCFLNNNGAYTNLTLSGGSSIVFRFYDADATCSVDSPWGRIAEIQYENGTPPAPIANFTGTPLSGVAPLNVAFTDTSENEYGGCTYNWSITPTTNVTGYIGSAENHVALFNDVGLYTVSHGVTCPSGSNISTKTNYINVTSSMGLTTALVSAIDRTNGYRILGSDISIYDVENTSWSNSTADPDGMHSITTEYGHHLNAYAEAYGYTSGENLGISNIFNNVDYAVYLTNENDYNASAGNVTLNIRVEDGDTLQPISGAGVSATTGGGPGFSLMTDSMGLVNIIVANQTTYNIRAIKTNYIPGTKNINTGNAPGPGAVVPVTILLYKSSVTTAPTVTGTGTGGGTVAPTQTYLKYCDPSQPDYNEDACRTSENTGMMDQLREAGPSIIGLCIVAIIMGLLKIIMG